LELNVIQGFHRQLLLKGIVLPMQGKKTSKQPSQQLISIDLVEQRIYLIRGHRVMVDSDLAALYGVTTFNLNKAVKRNIDRFPEDFMFQLTKDEADVLRFQIGMTKSTGRGGRRYLPYVFTQEGVAMLSSVLRSPSAVQVNISIMRAFVRLREVLATHKDLARKLDELEKKYDAKFKKNDTQFKAIFEIIRKMLKPQIKTHRRIGFTTKGSK
jgi:hypothetical protein